MKKPERTTRPTRPEARRGDKRNVVFLPDHIELELVAIIGGTDHLPGSEAIDSSWVDSQEGLRAVFDCLREGSLAAELNLQFFCEAAHAAGNRPLH